MGGQWYVNEGSMRVNGKSMGSQWWVNGGSMEVNGGQWRVNEESMESR